MKTLHYIVLAACLTILICSATIEPPASLAAKEQTTLVSVEDIGAKVKLVGRLGEPLGTIVEVKGTWRIPVVRPPEVLVDSSPRFIIDEVDGRTLKNPVEFKLALVKAVYRGRKNAIPDYSREKTLDGVSWTLRAYETGGFRGRPNNWYKEEGTYPETWRYSLNRFTSELVGVVQEGK